jgi:hypothetical protein
VDYKEASPSANVQCLALDNGTFEWYKDRVDGGCKSLSFLVLLDADDSPALGRVDCRQDKVVQQRHPGLVAGRLRANATILIRQLLSSPYH